MKISVLGVGYVGIHPVINFSKLGHEVVGFDISEERISTYRSGKDPIGEVGDQTIAESNALFTTNIEDMRGSDIYIIAVPTDIDENFKPDLRPLISASNTVAQVIDNGEIVVYESTVHPGATEKYCFPVLTEVSGKTIGVDFDVVYTPERVDPGNKVNTVKNTPRVIGGTTPEATEKVASLYEEYIVEMVRVTDIKTAEAIKSLENTQRDINIALMNSVERLYDEMGIDVIEVIKAAATKWNFMEVYPGLVGGHCIPVDPYYLIQVMEEYNTDPSLLQASRATNESQVDYYFEKATKDIPLDAKVLVLGKSFKANVIDTRNSKNIKFGELVLAKFPNAVHHDILVDGPIDQSKFDHVIELVKHTVTIEEIMGSHN